MKHYIWTIVSVLFAVNTMFSQISVNGPGQRTQLYIAVSGLDQIPPLHSDMSLDCMVAYIVMDSLARKASINEVFDKPLTVSLDSLRVSARYMYALTDYSPNLMRRYMTTTRDSIPGNHYLSFPANSYYGLQRALERRLDEFGKDYGMLLMTHYILRVIIDTTVAGIDTTYGKPLPWMNVSCTVQDQIKGKILPNNCNYNDNKKVSTLISEACLNFGYPINWMTGGGFNNEKPQNTGTYINEVKSGEEYYVFLTQLSLWENADILVPLHAFESSGGLFKILDGHVSDPDNFWGLGTNPLETEFKTHLDSLISNISTWWIP